MKKALSLILVVILLTALCSCATDNKNTGSGDSVPGNTTAGQTQESTQGNTDETVADPTQSTTESTNAAVTDPTECSHSYKDATCSAPKTCSKCGATEGKALAHTWKDATCTAPKTCSKCKATSGKALGHKWKSATCAAPKTCSRCKTTKGSKGAHNFVNGVCKVCKATDSINPKKNIKIDKEYVSKSYDAYDETTISAPGISFYKDGDSIGCLLLDAMFSCDPEEIDTSRTPVTYNGKKYYRIGGGMSPAEVKLTEKEITITHEGSTIKVIMTSDGNFKVTSSNHRRFPDGLIMSISWNYLK